MVAQYERGVNNKFVPNRFTSLSLMEIIFGDDRSIGGFKTIKSAGNNFNGHMF